MTYIVARNGEHLSGKYNTREDAHQRIEEYKIQDIKDAKEGWIAKEHLKHTFYDILKRR